MIALLCGRLESLDPHLALFFLTHYVSVPRLTYLLRSAPMFKEGETLERIDEIVRATLTKAVNVDVTGPAWTQAALPTRMGGLGIRRVSDLARPCFLASMSSSASLISRICPSLGDIEELHSWCLARDEFLRMASVPNQPEGEATSSQKAWSDLAAESTKERLLATAHKGAPPRCLLRPHSRLVTGSPGIKPRPSPG